MSGLPVPARKNQFVSAPRSFESAGRPGQVAAFSVSTTATYVDLTKGLSQAATDLTVSGQNPKTPTRNFLTIVSDVDLGVILGKAAADVTVGNVPALATVGTLASGVYTGVAQTCWYIPAKTPTRFLLQEGVDNFLGVVASGVGTCRIYQSSPDDA